MPELVADCSRCFGLCCVLLPFRAADGFGADKPGGEACATSPPTTAAAIHATCSESGLARLHGLRLPGAGQQVAQVTYGGVSWREQDNLGEMAAVLSVMRVLHEMLAPARAGRRPGPARPQIAADARGDSGGAADARPRRARRSAVEQVGRRAPSGARRPATGRGRLAEHRAAG